MAVAVASAVAAGAAVMQKIIIKHKDAYKVHHYFYSCRCGGICICDLLNKQTSAPNSGLFFRQEVGYESKK
jgi:hypothetical protein